jgi:hypothetical protein
VISVTLRAIAGLPRDFSAIHILREADALRLVEQEFQSYFDKDTTIGVNSGAEGASYCKAWMNLIRGTSKQWPSEPHDPLWKLQDPKDTCDIAAIATCVTAASEFPLDAHSVQSSHTSLDVPLEKQSFLTGLFAGF